MRRLIMLLAMLSLTGCWYLDEVSPTTTSPISMSVGDEYYSNGGYRNDSIIHNNNVLWEYEDGFIMQLSRVMYSNDMYIADLRLAIDVKDSLATMVAYPLSEKELHSDKNTFNSFLGINRDGVYTLYKIIKGWILFHNVGNSSVRYDVSASFELTAIDTTTDERVEITSGEFSVMDMQSSIYHY